MYITGLDIGSSNIKAVVFERLPNRKPLAVGVLSHSSRGFRKGILIDFEEALVVLRKVMLDIQRISRKASQNIFVNTGSSHIRTYVSRGVAGVARADGEIQEDDIERAAQAARAVSLPQNYAILHHITREFLVDGIGDIQDPLGMTGTRLEMDSLVVSSFSPFINSLAKCVSTAGGSVQGIIFNPLAASQSVLSKHQKELGVMIVDIGFGTTSFAVYEENKLIHAGTVPVGSGNVTNDIAVGFRTAVEVAEKMKLEYGFALASKISRRESCSFEEAGIGGEGEFTKRFLAEIIEVRLKELLELISGELRKAGIQNKLPAGGVFVGGGSKLPGLTDLAKQELRLPVQIGIPDMSFCECRNAAYEEALNDPEFAVAVGLALWGMIPQSRFKSLPRLGLIKRIIKNFLP